MPGGTNWTASNLKTPILRKGKRGVWTCHVVFYGGGEIRTHDTFRYGAFQVRCTRPLCDSSERDTTTALPRFLPRGIINHMATIQEKTYPYMKNLGVKATDRIRAMRRAQKILGPKANALLKHVEKMRREWDK